MQNGAFPNFSTLCAVLLESLPFFLSHAIVVNYSVIMMMVDMYIHEMELNNRVHYY